MSKASITTEKHGGDDELILLLGGRYVVEVNIDGIACGSVGEWTNFTVHDDVTGAIKACSAFMWMAKEQFGAEPLESELDGLIEPWVRVVDRWEEEPVAWVEDNILRIRELE